MPLLSVGCVTVCIVLCITAASGETASGTAKDKNALKLTIIGAGHTVDDIGVIVLIENTGPNSVTVLKEFRPVPVFFSLNLTKADGTPIGAPGGGKISFGGEVQYVTLAPGELVGISIPLKDVVTDLHAGKYTLMVEYHNQYGENCFQGTLASNTIDIVVADRMTRPAPSIGANERH